MDLLWLAFVCCLCSSSAFRAVSDTTHHSSCWSNSSDFASITSNADCLCPKDRACLRKCCPPNMAYQNISDTLHQPCVPAENTRHLWHPSSLANYTNFKGFANSSDDLHIVLGVPCRSFYFWHQDDFSITKEGVFFEDKYNSNETLFCLEYIQGEEKIVPLLCNLDSPDFAKMAEMPVENLATDCKPEPLKHVQTYIQLAGCMVSMLFLILTFLTYALVPCLQNVHGKNLMCYVLSLMIGYPALFTVTAPTEELFELPNLMCQISALTMQFSFLASFFWLNVMCFDLWWTFSDFRSFNGSPREQDSKKFLIYCLYAWGCPTLIVATTIFVEYSPDVPETFIKPNFGENNCWFGSKAAILIYFYGFISIIVFSNALMFINTTLILRKHKKETKVIRRNGSRRHVGVVDNNDKQRFNLYLKLFIIMGVNWILEVISFYYPGPAPLWVITDISNTLQGVLIFLIFVCKRRVLLLVNKRLCPSHFFFNVQRRHTLSLNTSVSSIASARGANLSVNKLRLDRIQNAKTLDFAV